MGYIKIMWTQKSSTVSGPVFLASVSRPQRAGMSEGETSSPVKLFSSIQKSIEHTLYFSQCRPCPDAIRQDHRIAGPQPARDSFIESRKPYEYRFKQATT